MIRNFRCRFRGNDQFLEGGVVDIDIRGKAHFSKHRLNLTYLNGSALPLERDQKCVLVDVTRLEDVQVVEELADVVSRCQLLLGQRRCQELGVRDVLVSIKAKLLEELLHVCDRQSNFRETLIDLPGRFKHLLLTDGARVVGIDALKSSLILRQLLVVDQVDRHH